MKPFSFKVLVRQSKIQNRKWAGIFAIVVALSLCSVTAEAQLQRKAARVGILRSGVSDTTGAQDTREAFRRGLLDLDGLKDKIFQLSTATPKGSSRGSLASSWS